MIQGRTLKTEVEKGFMQTGIGHGLVGPKSYGEIPTGEVSFSEVKGNLVNIQKPGCGCRVATLTALGTTARGT